MITMEVGEESPGRTPRSRQVGELRVHHESCVQQIVHTLIHRFEVKQHTKVTLVASGNAVPTAILSAEAIRRRIPDIYQITSSTYETKDFPRTGTKNRIWSRRIPILLIQLSTLPLDITAPGYQAPLPLSEVNVHEEPIAFYDNYTSSTNSTSLSSSSNSTRIPTATVFESDATFSSTDISVNYGGNFDNYYHNSNMKNTRKGKSKNNGRNNENIYSNLYKKKPINSQRFSFIEGYVPIPPILEFMNHTVPTALMQQLFITQAPTLSPFSSPLSAYADPFVSQSNPSSISTPNISTNGTDAVSAVVVEPSTSSSSSSISTVPSTNLPTVTMIQPMSPLLSYNNTSITSLGSTVTLSPTSTHTLLSSSPSFTLSSSASLTNHSHRSRSKLRSESIPYTTTSSNSNDNRSTVSSIYASSSYGVSTNGGNYTHTPTNPSSSQEISIHSNTSIASSIVGNASVNDEGCTENENNNNNGNIPGQGLSKKKSYALVVQSTGTGGSHGDHYQQDPPLSSPTKTVANGHKNSSTNLDTIIQTTTKNKFLALSKVHGKPIERTTPIITTVL